MTDAIKHHWPEYLIEAGGLGLFMISASGFAAVLFHPASPGSALAPVVRRLLMGMAMGLTAITLIYSPWGKQSGAHFNPAVTLTFVRLGRVAPWDAAFYVGAQFAGSIAGLTAAVAVAGGFGGGPAGEYIAPAPGARGPCARSRARAPTALCLPATGPLSTA